MYVVKIFQNVHLRYYFSIYYLWSNSYSSISSCGTETLSRFLSMTIVLSCVFSMISKYFNTI